MIIHEATTKGIAESVMHLIENSYTHLIGKYEYNLIQTLGFNAHSTVQKYFTTDIQMKKYEKIYLEIVGKH